MGVSSACACGAKKAVRMAAKAALVNRTRSIMPESYRKSLRRWDNDLMNDRAHPASPRSATADPVLTRTVEGRVAILTLNRAREFNALSGDLLDALHRELDYLADNDSVRVVIVPGAGRAFCSGHDLKEMRASEPGRIEALFASSSAMMLKLVALPQPVIAAVNGIATAAGCQLVAQCDLALASENARFAASGINLRLFCSTPAVPLSRNIPRKRPPAMVFPGEIIQARTAPDCAPV